MSEDYSISDTAAVKRSSGSDHYWACMAERLGFDIAVKRAMAKDLECFQYKREYLCQMLSHELGRPISVPQMDAFLAESKSHRLPAAMIPAWVKVTKSRRLLEILCQACGVGVADETERQFAELGRAEIRRRKAESEVSELRSELWDKA